MHDDDFWEIIDAANSAAASVDDRAAALKSVLASKSPEELIAFEAAYAGQVNKAYRWDLWGAAYVINGGCSDDGFDYFRDWLISEGRQRFDAALENPESLADMDIDEGEAEFEEFRYVVLEVFEERTGHQMDRREPQHPDRLDPAGEPWDEDDVAALYPRLAAKMGW